MGGAGGSVCGIFDENRMFYKSRYVAVDDRGYRDLAEILCGNIRIV